MGRVPVSPVRRPPALTPAASFTVLVGGAEVAIARVEGLGLSADPERLKHVASADDRSVAWSAPVLPVRVTLVRAVDGDRTLYDWRREAQDGKPALRDVALSLLDRPGGKPVHRWAAPEAWPVAWRGPLLDAMSGDLAFEALDFVCADLRWL